MKPGNFPPSCFPLPPSLLLSHLLHPVSPSNRIFSAGMWYPGSLTHCLPCPVVELEVGFLSLGSVPNSCCQLSHSEVSALRKGGVGRAVWTRPLWRMTDSSSWPMVRRSRLDGDHHSLGWEGTWDDVIIHGGGERDDIGMML